MLDSNTRNHLIVSKQMSSGSFKNEISYKLFTYKSYTFNTYKQDLALNDLQRLICNHSKQRFFSHASSVEVTLNLLPVFQHLHTSTGLQGHWWGGRGRGGRTLHNSYCLWYCCNFITNIYEKYFNLWTVYCLGIKVWAFRYSQRKSSQGKGDVVNKAATDVTT